MIQFTQDDLIAMSIGIFIFSFVVGMIFGSSR